MAPGIDKSSNVATPERLWKKYFNSSETLQFWSAGDESPLFVLTHKTSQQAESTSRRGGLENAGQRHIQPRGGARGAEAYLDYLKSELPIPTHPACHVRRDLPSDVDEILAMGLARDRHRRPATVEQFCDDLEVVLRAAAPVERRASLFARTMDRFRSVPRIRTLP